MQLKTVYATSHDILLHMSGIQLQTLKEKKIVILLFNPILRKIYFSISNK